MPKLSEMFPSKYLKPTDIEDEDAALTIKSIKAEEVGQERDNKYVLYFKEIDKGLVMNKTNTQTIAKVLKSDDTDEWIGKQITLYATEVEFKGESILGIRVRLKAPKTSKPAAVAEVKSEDDDDESPF
jgi:hypothetical protein